MKFELYTTANRYHPRDEDVEKLKMLGFNFIKVRSEPEWFDNETNIRFHSNIELKIENEPIEIEVNSLDELTEKFKDFGEIIISLYCNPFRIEIYNGRRE